MKRDDFMFTVGYQGETALVDKKAKSEFGSKSTQELIEAGLYKPAFCGALFDDHREDLERVVSALNSSGERTYGSVEEVMRLLGVYRVPENITKINYI